MFYKRSRFLLKRRAFSNVIQGRVVSKFDTQDSRTCLGQNVHGQLVSSRERERERERERFYYCLQRSNMTTKGKRSFKSSYWEKFYSIHIMLFDSFAMEHGY